MVPGAPQKTTKEPAGPLKIQTNRDLTPIYDPDLQGDALAARRELEADLDWAWRLMQGKVGPNTEASGLA